MSAKGTTLLTLADVAKEKNKAIGSVAEVLVRHNPILNDIPYMPMNEGTIHKESIRSGLPDVFYRKANQPIPASKSTTEERTFSAAHFESKSLIDEMVAKRGGKDRIAYNRWNQAQGHLQAMAIEQANLLVYGSPSDDARKVSGFMDVFSQLTGNVGNQVIDGGGSGSDNASILLVFWGEQSVFGVYPEGCEMGIKREDMSAGGKLVQIQGTTENSTSGHYWGYEERFMVDHGLVVKDYRQASRIANIDVSDLVAGSGLDLLEAMIEQEYQIDSLENGQGVYYMNRTLMAHLDKQARTYVGAAGGLTYMDYQGQRVLSFRGRPIRRCDAMLNTEAAVS